MRTFFLRNEILTRCGTLSGNGRGGIAYFCPSCGEVWGRVHTGATDWMAANIPCGTCGFPDRRTGFCPGSYLKPLAWWSYPGQSTGLPEQLNSADKTLLLHETHAHINWLLKETQ